MILCELITVVITYSYSLFNDTSAVIGHHNNILVNRITVNIIIRWRTICYHVIGYLIPLSRSVIFVSFDSHALQGFIIFARLL